MVDLKETGASAEVLIRAGVEIGYRGIEMADQEHFMEGDIIRTLRAGAEYIGQNHTAGNPG